MSRGTVVYLTFFLLSVFLQDSEELSLFKKKTAKAFRIRELLPCQNSGSLDVVVYNSSIQMLSRGATSVYCYADVKRDIPRLTELKVSTKRCASFSELETCEFYTKYVFKDICKVMEISWMAAFLEVVKPEVYRKCPWPKGKASVSNATFGITTSGNWDSYFPGFSDHYWRMTTRLYNGKRNVGCVIIGFDVIDVPS